MEHTNSIVFSHIPHTIKLVTVPKIIHATIMQLSISPAAIVHIATLIHLVAQTIAFSFLEFTLISDVALCICHASIAVWFAVLLPSFNRRRTSLHGMYEDHDHGAYHSRTHPRTSPPPHTPPRCDQPWHDHARIASASESCRNTSSCPSH